METIRNIKNNDKIFKCSLFFLIILTQKVATATSTGLPRFWTAFLPRELKIVFDSCMSRSNAGYCLQRKMVDVLDRALTKESIVLTDGVTLDRSKNAENVTEPMARQHNGPLSEMVWEKLDRFFNSRVISIDLAEEGRGKKKKKEMAYYAVAIATAMALLIPLTLKGLALLAGKALLVAKLALVLAGLAALKHFFHHGGGEDSHRRVHIEEIPDAHNLAYSAYSSQHTA